MRAHTFIILCVCRSLCVCVHVCVFSSTYTSMHVQVRKVSVCEVGLASIDFPYLFISIKDNISVLQQSTALSSYNLQ